jgi:hypothetical protein
MQRPDGHCTGQQAGLVHVWIRKVLRWCAPYQLHGVFLLQMMVIVKGCLFFFFSVVLGFELGLVLARQGIYHLSHTPSPFVLVIFE